MDSILLLVGELSSLNREGSYGSVSEQVPPSNTGLRVPNLLMTLPSREMKEKGKNIDDNHVPFPVMNTRKYR